MTSIHSFLALPKLFEQIDFVMFLGNMDTLWNTRKPEESLIDNNHRLCPREEQLLWACWYLEQTELSHAVLSPRLSVKHAAMARCSQSKYDMYDTLGLWSWLFRKRFTVHDSWFTILIPGINWSTRKSWNKSVLAGIVTRLRSSSCKSCDKWPLDLCNDTL